VLRLDRNERYLREVLGAITDRYGSQLTWNALVSELSIESSEDCRRLHRHPGADGCGRSSARARRARARPGAEEGPQGVLRRPVHPSRGARVPWAGGLGARSDAHLQRDLEAVLACHVARTAEVFYVKGAGEIDVAWYAGRQLQLLEAKWSRQLRRRS
jgi:predicted AAA+ superfamily ATPase